MDRREFNSLVLGSLVYGAFARYVHAEKLLAHKASGRVRGWVAAHDEIARQLAAGRIGGKQWQAETERLAKQLDRNELLAEIDFSAIERTLDLGHPGGSKRFVLFEHPDDPARQLSFATAVFGLQRNYAITPHAHRNMVSAHMVLKGQLHVRNFDRVGDDAQHVIISPTVDSTIRPGDVSTMSTERNNVHWFTALTPAAYTFDVIIDGLAANEKRYVIDLLDVRNAEPIGNGRRRARIIDWDESVRLYGIES